MESNIEMAFPQAVLTFVGGIGASVVGWAVLMQIISLSDRIRNIENHLSNYSNSRDKLFKFISNK
jgi:hypothetical protein